MLVCFVYCLMLSNWWVMSRFAFKFNVGTPVKRSILQQEQDNRIYRTKLNVFLAYFFAQCDRNAIECHFRRNKGICFFFLWKKMDLLICVNECYERKIIICMLRRKMTTDCSRNEVKWKNYIKNSEYHHVWNSVCWKTQNVPFWVCTVQFNDIWWQNSGSAAAAAASDHSSKRTPPQNSTVVSYSRNLIHFYCNLAIRIPVCFFGTHTYNRNLLKKHKTKHAARKIFVQRIKRFSIFSSLALNFVFRVV